VGPGSCGGSGAVGIAGSEAAERARGSAHAAAPVLGRVIAGSIPEVCGAATRAIMLVSAMGA